MPKQTTGGSQGEQPRKAQRIDWAAAAPTAEDHPFGWGDVNPSLIGWAIQAVTSDGAAISFAVNRAGTGGSITLLIGAPMPIKYYVKTITEAEAVLNTLIGAAA